VDEDEGARPKASSSMRDPFKGLLAGTNRIRMAHISTT
jgi:hypothetical protein